MSAAEPPTARLTRAAVGVPTPPVRLVHLGVGNFFRAHQAWYTNRAPDSAAWGIAAFTGRSSSAAEVLRPQDGLYTVITRGAHADEFETITTLAAVHAAEEHSAWLHYLRSADLAAVTLTVTEAGYRRGTDDALDETDPVVQRDAAALRDDPEAVVESVPARLLAGLLARYRSGHDRIAIVSCDNLSGNGQVTAKAVRDMAALVDPDMAPVVEATATFPDTVVDRITPTADETDGHIVEQATGWCDSAPVVTEPFREWTLSGEFPAGRPQWEHVGASLVTDVTPFEQRKLWLLNGGHSLLAYAAPLRGHTTVAEAVTDDVCLAWLRQWWDEAAGHLALPTGDVDDYRSALLERFANRRIRHQLAQIAVDGSQKLPLRVLPTLRAERAGGGTPNGAIRVLAAWVCHLRGLGASPRDQRADRILTAAAGRLEDAVPRVLGALDAALPDDAVVVSAVVAEARELLRSGGSRH